MTNILLVCAAGMSTSMLVNRMKVYAQGENISVNINALAISEAKEKIKKMKLMLFCLGQRCVFRKKEIEDVAQGLLPVAVIDMKSYGEMNGKAVLEFALALLAKK